MLNIQVLGQGLIPRGFGIAPRLEPFKADFTLISTILLTPGLSVKYQRPTDGVFLPLNKKDLKTVWDKYSNYKPTAEPVQPPVQPVTPVVTVQSTSKYDIPGDTYVKPVEAPVETSEPVVENVTEDVTETPEVEEKAEEVVGESKEDEKTFVPLKNNHNDNKNNYNNHKKK